MPCLQFTRPWAVLLYPQQIKWVMRALRAERYTPETLDFGDILPHSKFISAPFFLKKSMPSRSAASVGSGHPRNGCLYTRPSNVKLLSFCVEGFLSPTIWLHWGDWRHQSICLTALSTHRSRSLKWDVSPFPLFLQKLWMRLTRTEQKPKTFWQLCQGWRGGRSCFVSTSY